MQQRTRILLHNGSFYTAGGANPARSLLIEDGCIAALDPMPERAQGAERIDMDSAWIYPAFEDAHTHPAGRARTLAELDFRDMDLSWEEAKERIRARTREQAPGTWIVCHGWNSNLWDIKREELDALTGEHGIFILNVSYHGGVINTRGEALLHAQGIDVCHENGFVEEGEYQKVFIATSPSTEAYMDAIPLYHRKLHALGIVAAHDLHITSLDQLEAYRLLDERGELRMHTFAYLNTRLLQDSAALAPYLSHAGSEFSVRGIKLFADGAIGMYTAALSKPYANKPDQQGTLLVGTQDYLSYVQAAADVGLSEVAVHCIGDESVRVAVDACLTSKNAFPHMRWRFEHFEMTDDIVLDKVKASGAVVCIQPNFSWDIVHYENRLGSRVAQINQLKKIAERGIPYMFGSDDMPTDPVAGLLWATAKAPTPAHALPMDDAFNAYTYAPALYTGRGATWGRIAEGYWANFVVFKEDFFKNPSKENKIFETWFKGAPVYTSNE